MISSGDELETFKTNINLTEYAAASGYRLDRQASSRNSAVMVHPERDKIIIAVDRDRHWIYFTIGGDTDNGSIIDFVQKRKGGNLGDVRRALYAAMTSVDGHPYLLIERLIPSSVLADLRFAGRIRIDVRRNAVFPHI